MGGWQTWNTSPTSNRSAGVTREKVSQLHHVGLLLDWQVLCLFRSVKNTDTLLGIQCYQRLVNHRAKCFKSQWCPPLPLHQVPKAPVQHLKAWQERALNLKLSMKLTMLFFSESRAAIAPSISTSFWMKSSSFCVWIRTATVLGKRLSCWQEGHPSAPEMLHWHLFYVMLKLRKTFLQSNVSRYYLNTM